MSIESIKSLYNAAGIEALNHGEIERLFNAIIAERDNSLAQNAELVAQVSQQQSFIEDVMANIGAGATLAEVADMLCNWWDVRIMPTQCLRDVKAEAGRAGCLYGINALMKAQVFGGEFNAESTANKYAARVKAGEL